MNDVKPENNNRMVLLLIAGIPMTVVLIATWLWYYVVHGDLDIVALLGTSNSGNLVQPPRSLSDIRLRTQDGESFTLGGPEPGWVFVIPGGALCDSVCEQTLYTTRQIHTALGVDSRRVRRIYLSDTAAAQTGLGEPLPENKRRAAASFTALLAAEHSELVPVIMAAADVPALLREYREDNSTWYLVDPGGWIMMAYNSEVDFKGVLSDLKFLLKNSSG